MWFRRLASAMRWRYQVYLAEYIDLFGSLSYFIGCMIGFERYKSSSVAYVFANKRNIGDYISHCGVRHIVDKSGPTILCSPVGRFWYKRQLSYLLKHNPSCHVVIGGGGLLQGVFADFWEELICSNLSFSIVGVGVNILEGRSTLSRELLQQIVAKATFIGVRDELTQHYLQQQSGLKSPLYLHVCPSLNYLASLPQMQSKQRGYLLHMVHPSDLRLAGIPIDTLRAQVQQVAALNQLEYVEFDNMDSDHLQGITLVQCADLVVSSRLHGAIMSYGFGVPCAYILCDQKMGAFLSTHVGIKGIAPEQLRLEHGVEAIQNSLIKAKVNPSKVTSEQLQLNKTFGNLIREHICNIEQGFEQYYVNHK